MRKLLALIGIVTAFLVGAPSQTSAGGWAVVSFDTMPAVHPGEDAEIGFTVLRHGVTPENHDDLMVTLVDSEGTTLRFAAVQQGAVGHHIATINVPDEGSYRWSVRDQFGNEWAELGALTVTAPPSGASWRWDALQWGSATFALAMAGLAVIDFRRSRVRPAPVAAD